MIQEVWKPVNNYYGLYEVSNHGNVRSCDRIVQHKRGNKLFDCYVSGKLCKISKGAYPVVYLSKNDIRETYFVPDLVLSAFSEDYDGINFYHKDFDVYNNNIDNLCCGFRNLGDNWKPVKDTNDMLWVSKYGELYHRTHKYTNSRCTFIKPEDMIKPSIDIYGYSYIDIAAFPELHFVHRIVANTFIANIDNKPTVNHKDGNKLNNCVDNLEWATVKEQTDHAFNNNLRSYDTEIEKCRKMSEKNCHKVKCLNTNKIYPSIKSAALDIGITPEGLRSSIQNNKPLKSGLQFVRC